MKRIILLAFVLTLVFIACKKQYETRPQIKIKSISSNVIPLGGTLVIRLEFTDKEGDLGKDTLVSIRRRINIRALPGGPSGQPVGVDTLNNIIPDFPSKPKGEFEVKFDYTYLHQSDIQNDTVFFKFVAKDRGGHMSDTISTQTIVVLRQ